MWKRVLLSLVLIVAICGCDLSIPDWVNAGLKLAGEGIAEGMGYAATSPVTALLTNPINAWLNGLTGQQPNGI